MSFNRRILLFALLASPMAIASAHAASPDSRGITPEIPDGVASGRRTRSRRRHHENHAENHDENHHGRSGRRNRRRNRRSRDGDDN